MPMSHDYVASSDRLRFRPLMLGDEAYLFSEVDEELTKHWIGWEPSMTLEEEHAKIEEKLSLVQYPPNLEWMAFDAHDNFVGCCSITPSEEPGEFEVGLWVVRGEQGKGYGKEMLQSLVSWASQHTSLPYLVYSYTEGNEASKAIIEKWGAPFYREVSYIKRGARKRVFDYKIIL